MLSESTQHELCDIVYGRSIKFQDVKCDVLEICEFLLSDKLKSLCDDTGKEIDSKQSAKVLHRLGHVYWQRSPDKISLIRSAILYNAALIRNPGNAPEIGTELHELCSNILDLAGVKSTVANLTCIEKVVKKRIKKFRESVKKELDNIEFLHDRKSTEKEFQIEKSSAMKKLQQDIYDWYCDLMKRIMELCVSIKGKPPCEYALVGMGSLARKKITPYSDFEHIILLEEGVQERKDYEEILEYFRWVSVIFQIIVINIGETIVPCAALPYLNNSWNEEYNWFYDEVTKRGISFDGMFPHASKFPLGRSNNYGKPWKTELIKPVSEMLKYLSSDEKLKPGYHLADILTTTCFVSGNQNIWKKFQKRVRAMKVTHSSEWALQEQLEEDIRNFNPVGNLSKALRESKWNMKRVVYRSTTLFISALGRNYGLCGDGSFEIIRKLLENDFVEESFAHDLSYAVAIACHVRLSTYIENDRQEDWLEHSNTSNEFLLRFTYTMGEEISILYFQTAMKLQRETCEVAGLIDSQFVQWSPRLDRLLSCFWLQLYESTSREADDICNDNVCCTEDVKTVNEVLLAIGHFYLKADDFRHALPCFQQFQLSRQKLSLQTCEEDFMYCFYLIFDCISTLENFEEGLQYYRKELDVSMQARENKNVCLERAFSFCMVAGCLFELKRYEEAIQEFKNALLVFEHLNTYYLSTDDKSVEFVEIIAFLKVCTGDCLYTQQQFTDALIYYKEAMLMGLEWDEMVETSVKYFKSEARCLYAMENPDGAESTLEKAKALEEYFENATSETEKEIGIMSIGDSFYDDQMFDVALKYYKKVFDMVLEISTDGDYNLQLEHLFKQIGLRLFKMKKYDWAKSMFEKSLNV